MIDRTGLSQGGAYQIAQRLGRSSSTLAALGRYLGYIPRIDWAYYCLGIDKEVGYADHVARLCSLNGLDDWKSSC